MKKLTLFILLFPLYIFADSSKSVKFHKGSLTSAKEKAMVEGKLYFVDFVANYCYMCKMMDETTFRDDRVVSFMDENYIPVKINVDDFDGFVWKQQYNIKVLPTILIFNSSGNLVARHEESLGGTRLLEILRQHNTNENKIITRIAPIIVENKPSEVISVEENSSEEQPIPEDISSEENSVPLNSDVIGYSDAEEESPVVVEESYNESNSPSPTFENSNLPPVPENSLPVESEKNEMEGEGLFEFSVKRYSSNGFGIQIGVFQDYANVLDEVANLEEKIKQNIFVHITRLNDKLAYRVIVGDFLDKESAIQFHNNVMKNYGFSGFIKDLSSL